MWCISCLLALLLAGSVISLHVPGKSKLLVSRFAKITRVPQVHSTRTDENNPRERFLKKIWGMAGESSNGNKPLPLSAAPPQRDDSKISHGTRRNDTDQSPAGATLITRESAAKVGTSAEEGGVISWITTPFKRLSQATPIDVIPVDDDTTVSADDLVYDPPLGRESYGPLRRVRRSLGNVLRNTFRRSDQQQLPFEQGTASGDAIFLYADARTNRNMVRKRHTEEKTPQADGLYASIWQWLQARVFHAGFVSVATGEAPSAVLQLASPVDEYRVFGPTKRAGSSRRQRDKAPDRKNSTVVAVMGRVWQTAYAVALWSVGGPNLNQVNTGMDEMRGGEDSSVALQGGSEDDSDGEVRDTDANAESGKEVELEVATRRSPEGAREKTASTFMNLITAAREAASDATQRALRKLGVVASAAVTADDLPGTTRNATIPDSHPHDKRSDRADTARTLAQAALHEADARITQAATETSLRLIIMQQVYRIFKQKESQLSVPAPAELIHLLPAPSSEDKETRQERSQMDGGVPSTEVENEGGNVEEGNNPLSWIWDSLPLGKTRPGTEETVDGTEAVGPTVANAAAQAGVLQGPQSGVAITGPTPTTSARPDARGSGATPAQKSSAEDSINNVEALQGTDPDEISSLTGPESVDELLPSRGDFALIASRRAELAVTAAASVNSEFTAKEFLQHIGLKALLAGVITEPRAEAPTSRISAVQALNNLVRFHKPLAAELAARSDIISVLCDMIEIPSRRFASLQSQEQKKRQLSAQLEAVALIHRFVRSSEAAVDTLRQSVRLRKALTVVSQAGENVKAERSRGAATWAANAVAELQSVREGKADMKKNMKTYKVRKQSNVTAVAEYNDLQVHQMAKVASWGLGGVQWKPRVPGQRGLRILSLDGGGTRGVLSIAFLKEILKRVDRNLEPYQMFDLICGTSTGGIIATLLGAQQASLAEAEVLYDAFIDKIFAQRSNLRLVTEQAAYDGRDWEKILYDMCGDQLLLDSNQHDCARVFCVSTKVNVNPPLPNLWRNYNYPPGQRARYPGACRVNTFTAIRATTAAPTFFTPVQWENGLYCDGALVANNPTAIALQEAKMLYPNVPVELVVSIGTGYTTSQSSAQSMGWGALVNQLVASSTDTEDVHELLRDFLPPDKYFRFNPILPDFLRIDEKNKTLLSGLKSLAKKTIDGIEAGPGAGNFAQLIKTLRGPK